MGTWRITVRSGKGNKDRVTVLPASLRTPLSRHLDAVRVLHERDVLNGDGRVVVPEAIAKKYPSAPLDWRWQFVFPAARICRDPRWGPPGRFHLHESAVQYRPTLEYAYVDPSAYWFTLALVALLAANQADSKFDSAARG